MVRVALCVEYCGLGFVGWQIQRQGRSVQAVLEFAIGQIAAEKISVVCAGRTDAGVHATAQIVHFDTEAKRPVSAWVRGVNAHLPEGVAVVWAECVDERFHARFSALARRYRYVLFNRPVRPAVLSGRVGWYHQTLDVGAMAVAASYLVGQHDFSAFRASQCQAASPIRDLRSSEVSGISPWIFFDFEANAFLHHMIRNFVGALVSIGKGEHSPEWMIELLQRRDRRLSPPTFSPDGLYLIGVEYPDHWSLPDRGRIIAPLFLPVGL